MKYTRYNMRRKNNNNGKSFIIILVLMLVIAYGVGTFFSKIFLKNNDIQPKEPAEKTSSEVEKDETELPVSLESEYVIVQGGVFQNIDNANECLDTLHKYGNPFIFEDNDLNKVILGIYTRDEALNVKKSLDENNIDNSVSTFKINNDELSDKEISAILNAYLEIFKEVQENQLKSVSTVELKKWVDELEKPEETNNRYDVLMKLIENTKNLPESISENEIPEINKYIYNVLINFK